MTKNQMIRAYCLDCCCGDSVEVRKCPAVGCQFYPFRLGTEIMENRDKPERVCRSTAIKQKCRMCQGDRPCVDPNCVLASLTQKKGE